MILLLIPGFSLLCLLVYPMISHFLARSFPRKVQKDLNRIVPVSIIICCYNEAEYIGDRIDFFLSSEEWIQGSQLIIVTGGSTDGTDGIVRSYADRNGVELIIFDEQTPKIQGVNLAVDRSVHEILVFSDCRQKVKPGSVRHLIANFNDPEIGTVSSTLSDGLEQRKGSLFRRILSATARNDSFYDSSLNVYGALYAQRKSIFRTIPQDLLFDDLFVVVSTLVQGKRLIQEDAAVIYDVDFNDYYRNERIRRLVRGLLIFIRNEWSLVAKLSFQHQVRFFLFKYFKLIAPICLLFFAAGTIHLLMDSPLLLLALGVLFGILLIATLGFENLKTAVRFMFQTGIAIIYFILGVDRSNQWKKLSVKREI